MKEKIEVLNCGIFTQKTSGKKGTILRYRLLSPQYCVNTNYMKGYAEMALFTDTDELFNLLTSEMFGVACEVEYVEVSKNNPLEKKMKASKLKIGSSTFNLL